MHVTIVHTVDGMRQSHLRMCQVSERRMQLVSITYSLTARAQGAAPMNSPGVVWPDELGICAQRG